MECTEERIKNIYEYIYDATVGVGGKDETVILVDKSLLVISIKVRFGQRHQTHHEKKIT